MTQDGRTDDVTGGQPPPPTTETRGSVSRAWYKVIVAEESLCFVFLARLWRCPAQMAARRLTLCSKTDQTCTLYLSHASADFLHLRASNSLFSISLHYRYQAFSVEQILYS